MLPSLQELGQLPKPACLHKGSARSYNSLLSSAPQMFASGPTSVVLPASWSTRQSCCACTHGMSPLPSPVPLPQLPTQALI